MAGRYKFNETRKLSDGREVYQSKVLPKIPKTDNDMYIAVQGGDRLDSIAQEYLGDATLWWVIAQFNRKPTEGHLSPGDVIKLPINIGDALGVLL